LPKKNVARQEKWVVGKHIETETARVSLPLEKEQIIIERTTPTGSRTIPSPGKIEFQEDSSMKVYEEMADIHKEALYVKKSTLKS